MSSDGPPFIADRRSVLLAGAGASAALLAPPFVGGPANAAEAFEVGRALPFDAGWRFHRGPLDGAERSGFDDSAWRLLDLPHDWSIEDLQPSGDPPGEVVGPFTKDAIGGTSTGFTMGGEGWYRKRWRLAAPLRERVEILFDGIYRDSDMWLNGRHLGNMPSGYTPFAYDLTPHLSASGENVLAVRVRNLGHNSRWYAGSGIYRHVWLDIFAEPSRIARWGTAVTTRQISDAGALLELRTRLEDIGEGLTLASIIRDEKGENVWQSRVPATSDVLLHPKIASPDLWSPDTPSLYTLSIELRRGNATIDRQSIPFGIRIIAFDAKTGMTINDVPTRLRGGCIHHDNGLLGTASFDAAEERKVVLLKQRGYNAIRASHNPFAPAFLHACDRHGMLVIAEAFDSWRAPKLPDDYARFFDTHWKADLAAMVLSARNHPSIIMWSIGNEIAKRNRPDGIETQWMLANEVRRMDPSRPVTAAINAFAGRLVVPDAATARPGTAGIPDEASTVFLDVVGYNYRMAKYDSDHRQFPQRIIYGSESFPRDMFEIWDNAAATPYLLGDFVWTAMDYLGEAGIGGSVYQARATTDPMASISAWPEVISGCGDLDLLGGRKAASFARDVVWGLSDLEIAVQKPPPAGQVEVVRLWGWSDEQPSWTWPDSEGKIVKVRVYTSGDRVELRLDGALVAAKPVIAADRKRIEFEVAYAPGTLEALALRNGMPIARRQLVTTGTPHAVRVKPERASVGGGTGNVSFIWIEILDAEGRLIHHANCDLTLTIAGPATLVAFGNASRSASVSFQSYRSTSQGGKALAILRGTGNSGRVRIEARSKGLKAGAAILSFGVPQSPFPQSGPNVSD